MDNKIEIFTNSEFGELEVLMENDKFYFPAIQCAEVLGYTNPRKAIRDHCKGGTIRSSLTSGGKQDKKYIPEGDLYRLIIRSKLESAQRFEAWVFDDVLPTIRKYGIYATPEMTEQILGNPDFGISLLTELKKERSEKAALSEKVKSLAPKAMYYDMILQNPYSIPVTMISKDYGMSAQALNKILRDLGVQYCMRGTWELYQKHAKNGYTHTNVFVAPNGDQHFHTCWTQKGRLFLYELLKSQNILPTIEKECCQMSLCDVLSTYS